MFFKHYSNVLIHPSTSLFVVVVLVFFTGVDSAQNHTVLVIMFLELEGPYEIYTQQ